jgi:hypothetical protein
MLLPTLSGCFHTMAPTQPKILASAITSYPANEYKANVTAYRTAIAQGTPAGYTLARALRDQIVYRTLADIESTYGRFEVRLTTDRASESVLADTAELGLSAASTVVAASDIKDILTVSLSGLEGTQLSFDKNFFREKTTESLISQMRADRKNLEAQIISRLAGQDVIPTTDPATKTNIAAYPLDAAWIDVIQYYYAGTVPSALTSIATTTGNNATKAADTLTKTVQSLKPATAAQAKSAQEISKKLNLLYNTATGTDAQAAANAITALRGILTAISRPAADGASPESLMDAISQARQDASVTNPNQDEALATKLEAALANLK